MIRLNNVSKHYKTNYGINRVFHGLHLEIPCDRNIGILGRNGVGKSTLLRIIAGIEEPSCGKVTREVRVSWPLGFSGGFNGSLSGRENCRFVSRIYMEDIVKVTNFVKDFSELGKYFDMPLRTYSAGMKARLAFGLSMALEFETYLVDEVTAVGDATFQKKCKQAFAERRERSNIIMVSHNFATLKEYCTYIAILEAGCIKVYDNADEAIEIYNMQMNG